jgi:hypothetical protein
VTPRREQDLCDPPPPIVFAREFDLEIEHLGISRGLIHFIQSFHGFSKQVSLLRTGWLGAGFRTLGGGQGVGFGFDCAQQGFG